MGWTTPKTWSSEPLTSIDLNTYMRDNQNHLKDRLDSSAGNSVSGPTSLTTTSTAFVDVDAEKLALTLTTHGGDVLLGFTGTVQSSAGNGSTSFNVSVDGVDYVADDGIIRSSIAFNLDNNRDKPLSFVILIPRAWRGRAYLQAALESELHQYGKNEYRRAASAILGEGDLNDGYHQQ